MNNQGNDIYFLGIGGIGMSALARFFKSEGKIVRGYDLTPTPLTDALELEGIEISFIDDPNLIINKPDWVVYTPAIPAENAILKYFKKEGIPMLKRAAVLGEISKDYFTVAVAGTHGKTTITSLISHILKYNKKPVTAFVGGVCKNYDSNLILSKPTEIIVVEADEFDRSFLTLKPDIAVVSSMDADHLDIYGSKKYLEESFNLFAHQIKDGGQLYAYKGLNISTNSEVTKTEYSVNGGTIVEATNLKTSGGRTLFKLKTETEEKLNINSFLPGIHNAANISAAVAVCCKLGLSAKNIEKGIESYLGVQRRFDVRLKTDKIVYIDDYAHHPEEIRATIKAVRTLYENDKLTVIFQPHLYSRTRDFADDFASALSLADELLLMDIYPAREKPIPGITSDWLLNMVSLKTKKMTNFDTVINDVIKSKPRIILSLGAGSIDRIVEPIEKALI